MEKIEKNKQFLSKIGLTHKNPWKHQRNRKIPKIASVVPWFVGKNMGSYVLMQGWTGMKLSEMFSQMD